MEERAECPILATPLDGPRRFRVFAVNASTIQWLLKRRDEQHLRDTSRVDDLESALTELRVNLPLEYVRREDWIRFTERSTRSWTRCARKCASKSPR